jgi:hypothetical protein
MTAKWGLLHRPIRQKLCNVKYYAHSIARLHNFCIKERLITGDSEWDRRSVHEVPYECTVPNLPGLGPEFPMGSRDNPFMYRSSGYSHIRNVMVNHIRAKGLSRPSSSVLYRNES